MGKASTVIHCNRGLAHQIDWARALRSGFAANGIKAEISESSDTPAAVHVVLGPWFAYRQWRYSNTLMLDRAYWGDPDCASLHWLKDGEKVFLRDMPYRRHPVLKPEKTGSRRIYLCDYQQGPEGEYHTVRHHPAEKPGQGSLIKALEAHDIARGGRSTALVDAAIYGLRVETVDPYSPVYGLTDRQQWIQDLAWHNWSHDEISRGEMWEYL